MSNIYIDNKPYNPNEVFLGYPTWTFSESDAEKARKKVADLDQNKDGYVTFAEAGQKTLEFTLLAHNSWASVHFAPSLDALKQQVADRIRAAEERADKATYRSGFAHYM